MPGPAALANGLEVLRLLAEADAPLTATAIAAKLDLHVSTASRVLAALAAAGYVRKPDYHAFACDWGVLTLGANAGSHFPAIARVRPAISALTAAQPWAHVHIARLHQGQLVYLATGRPDGVIEAVRVGRYPLHLSAVALRLLLDQPRRTALAALAASRRRYGWTRPTLAVPVDEAGCLDAARARLDGGALLLADWQRPGHLAAAIAVDGGDGAYALALTGPLAAASPTIAAALRAGAGLLAEALAAPVSDPAAEVPA